MAAGDAGAKYALGSVLNHVLLHQVGLCGRAWWSRCCRRAGLLMMVNASQPAQRLRPILGLSERLPSRTSAALQTVIGEEALEQLAQVGETPDLLVGCTGGGR